MTTSYPHKELFKTFLKVVLFLTLIFWIFILFQGCAAKPKENIHTIERTNDHKIDSVKSTEINKAILDTLIIKVAKVKTAKPECDSIAQATIDQLLKQLNTSKKSGYNEAKVYYDSILKQIVVAIKVGQTENKSTAIKETEKTTDKDKNILPPIRVQYIPFWAKCLCWCGGLSLAFVVYRISRIWTI